MKNFMVVGCTLILCSGICFSQETEFGGSSSPQNILGHESGPLHIDIAWNPTELPLNGDAARLLSSQPLLGVSYLVSVLGLDFAPALYVFGDINIKNGDGENWDAGVAFGFKVWRGGILGIGWTGLREGEGLTKFGKDNFALLFGYTIKSFSKGG